MATMFFYFVLFDEVFNKLTSKCQLKNTNLSNVINYKKLRYVTTREKFHIMNKTRNKEMKKIMRDGC